MKRKLFRPEWSERRTDDELLALAALIQDHKTIEARWEAFKSSDLYRSEVSKASFKDAEANTRYYIKLAREAGEEFDADIIRLAIGYQWGYWLDPPSYEEMLSKIERRVEVGDESSYEPIETAAPKPDVGSNDSMRAARLIGYSIGFVPVGLIALLVLGAFNPSPEEEAAAKEALLDECVDRLSEDIRRSCRGDPEFSYCSFNYESHEIMGSGCTRAVKSQGGYQQQVDFCTTKSLSNATRTCYIKIYGCAAFTGDVNC